ncbi:SIR2 family protein [Homoserinibacter sp. GY 40078]|uniref:SIR2 family protein n=1 Tax=Homoserinibacter sp. GY 40078 TaxID=2603275 RepID=UPI0011CCD8CC|nr:SIR2 family protein [Homoserinibacter sp. GY 40078]TXK17426.1 hypothetical protein FVQ89_11380 [Homoserinibacter sp. GY 40078]
MNRWSMSKPGPDARNAAVLVGNGLSIAFNPELGLGRISEEVLKRMASGTEGVDEAVADAMKKIADSYSASGQADYSDFENIVGAFGGQSSMLADLKKMADLVESENPELLAAIEKAAEFAMQVRDAGVSHVLEVIFEQARAYSDDMGEMYEVTHAIVGAFDGVVTFGNLNYDTLLLSALLETCKPELADLGHGWRKGTVTTGKTTKHEVPMLRRTLDFPEYARVHLLQLHGSLNFWGNGKSFYKLDTTFLGTYRPWETVRRGRTALRPAVVLANQRDKTGAVTQYPFALAYTGLASALADSSHWLVVGYSFRDVCVNDLFEAELRGREKPPAMLVVTLGDRPSRREVEAAVGWDAARGDSKAWLRFDRRGASGFAARGAWSGFIS